MASIAKQSLGDNIMFGFGLQIGTSAAMIAANNGSPAIPDLNTSLVNAFEFEDDPWDAEAVTTDPIGEQQLFSELGTISLTGIQGKGSVLDGQTGSTIVWQNGPPLGFDGGSFTTELWFKGHPGLGESYFADANNNITVLKAGTSVAVFSLGSLDNQITLGTVVSIGSGWFQVIIVFDSDAQTVAGYLNGTLKGTVNVISPDPGAGGIFGQFNTAVYNTDSWRIWSEAFDQTKITWLNNGNAGRSLADIQGTAP